MWRLRSEVVLVTLVALAACSGDRLTQSQGVMARRATGQPPPGFTVLRAKVRWTDAAGAMHEVQLPPHRVPLITVPRSSRSQQSVVGPDAWMRAASPLAGMMAASPHAGIVANLTTTSEQETDSAGNQWTFSFDQSDQDAPQTFTSASVNDTATYAQYLTWTAVNNGDDWALTEVDQTITTSTFTGGGSEAYDTLQNMAMAPPWSTRFFAHGREVVTSLAAKLFLPQPAYAATIRCLSEWLNLAGADIAYAGATMALVAQPYNPVLWMAYWSASAFVAGAEVSLYNCLSRRNQQ